MLLFVGGIGAPEIILILFLALILFGPSKLPEMGRSLGKGIREFKKSTSGLVDSINDEMNAPPKQQTTTKPVASLPAPSTESNPVVAPESKPKAEPVLGAEPATPSQRDVKSENEQAMVIDMEQKETAES